MGFLMIFHTTAALRRFGWPLLQQPVIRRKRLLPITRTVDEPSHPPNRISHRHFTRPLLPLAATLWQQCQVAVGHFSGAQISLISDSVSLMRICPETQKAVCVNQTSTVFTLFLSFAHVKHLIAEQVKTVGC